MKNQYATFIDAGLLRALALGAAERPAGAAREAVFDAPALGALLREMGERACPGSRLLRHYFFDGARNRQPSEVQCSVARARDFELRLGKINVDGVQKGVDSALVAEMVALAVGGQVSDVILVGSDYDLFPGFELAKLAGCRVHLVDFETCGGKPCHELLLAADTSEPWGPGELAKVVSLARVAEAAESLRSPAVEIAESLAIEFGATLSSDELCAFKEGAACQESRRLDWRLRKYMERFIGSEPTGYQIKAARSRLRVSSALAAGAPLADALDA